MAEFATRGIGNAALTTGIIGTAGWALNGGLQNLLGGVLGNGCNNNCNNGAAEMAAMAALMTGVASACSKVERHGDRDYDRYDAGKDAEIAELRTEVKLRDANTYTDQKTLETYKYVDGRLRDIESQICAQAVINQQTKDSFALAAADLAAVKADLDSKIKLEAERRCCADNSIVRYVNATFYPKLVADVTAGTTTTAQALYDPLPDCGCCGK